MRQGLAATPSPFSSLPGSAEALRQPRLREAKLAQHRGLVPLLPAFGHPAVENAIEDEPPTRIGLPVGRAPANGPVFVPSATNRVATLSPALMWSSMVK